MLSANEGATISLASRPPLVFRRAHSLAGIEIWRVAGCMLKGRQVALGVRPRNAGRGCSHSTTLSPPRPPRRRCIRNVSEQTLH